MSDVASGGISGAKVASAVDRCCRDGSWKTQRLCLYVQLEKKQIHKSNFS